MNAQILETLTRWLASKETISLLIYADRNLAINYGKQKQNFSKNHLSPQKIITLDIFGKIFVLLK